ncbi:hypothetical protein Trydic_g7290 [Trypoxylus dichotomus]
MLSTINSSKSKKAAYVSFTHFEGNKMKHSLFAEAALNTEITLIYVDLGAHHCNRCTDDADNDRASAIIRVGDRRSIYRESEVLHSSSQPWRSGIIEDKTVGALPDWRYTIRMTNALPSELANVKPLKSSLNIIDFVYAA